MNRNIPRTTWSHLGLQGQIIAGDKTLGCQLTNYQVKVFQVGALKYLADPWSVLAEGSTAGRGKMRFSYTMHAQE